MPARSDARRTWEVSKMSASSIRVSPWRVTTSGHPAQAGQCGGVGAVRSEALDVQHVGPEGGDRPAQRRASCANPVVAAWDTADTRVAGSGIGKPADDETVAHLDRLGGVVVRQPVHTSTSSPAATSARARCRVSSSTPPTDGG